VKDDGLHVALKELKCGTADSNYKVEDAWKLEADSLYALRRFKTPHLVHIIGAFKQSQGPNQGHRYFLLLEWAQGGNLREFLEKNRAGRLDENKIRSYVYQILGLSEALKELHRDDR